MTEFVHDIQETVARVAELRMRHTEMSTVVEDRISREHDSPRKIEPVHPYLSISCEAGAGGSEVASRVAARAGVVIRQSIVSGTTRIRSHAAAATS